jgi:hypothetical protein
MIAPIKELCYKLLLSVEANELGRSRISPSFMEPKGLLSRSQEPITGPCCETDGFSSNSQSQFLLRSISML